jgi:hypothetical protein
LAPVLITLLRSGAGDLDMETEIEAQAKLVRSMQQGIMVRALQ